MGDRGRKDLPLKDLAAAGGWKDVTMVLTVMESRVKLVSRRAASALEKRR
jgi:hypothetical protein